MRTPATAMYLCQKKFKKGKETKAQCFCKGVNCYHLS